MRSTNSEMEGRDPLLDTSSRINSSSRLGSKLVEDEGLQNGTSPIQAGVAVVKCAIGAGSFSLPFAFMQGGLYASTILTFFLGLLSAYTLIILGKSEREIVRRVQLSLYDGDGQGASNQVTRKLTYPDIGRLSFPEANIHFNSLSKPINLVAIVIYIGICMTSIGVCAAYLDFLHGTLPSVIPGLSEDTAGWAVFPFILLLSYIKDFRYLSFTSILGDIAVTAGLLTVLGYGIDKHGSDSDFDQPFVNWQSLPRFFGSTAFLFAIHIVILPIMQSMKDPHQFSRVISVSYVFITLINAIFGFISLVVFYNTTCDAYDDDEGSDGPCGNILDSIGGSAVLKAVKLLVCIDLLFTVPMVLAASREILEESIINWVFKIPTGGRDKFDLETLSRYFIRSSLVLAIYGIAFGVPDFQNMVGLVGGFVNSLMGFIIPPLIYIRLHSTELSPSSLTGHVAITCFGLFALIVSTMLTMQDIIAAS